MKRTIQSQFRTFDQMSFGTAPYGAQVIKEKTLTENMTAVLIERRYFRSYPRPKTETSYAVVVFTWNEKDGVHEEERRDYFKKKSEALACFKAITAADYSSPRVYEVTFSCPDGTGKVETIASNGVEACGIVAKEYNVMPSEFSEVSHHIFGRYMTDGSIWKKGQTYKSRTVYRGEK